MGPAETSVLGARGSLSPSQATPPSPRPGAAAHAPGSASGVASARTSFRLLLGAPSGRSCEMQCMSHSCGLSFLEPCPRGASSCPPDERPGGQCGDHGVGPARAQGAGFRTVLGVARLWSALSPSNPHSTRDKTEPGEAQRQATAAGEAGCSKSGPEDRRTWIRSAAPSVAVARPPVK